MYLKHIIPLILPCIFWANDGLGQQPANVDKLRTDIHGDSLPRSALARMGTVRLRHAGGILDMFMSPDGRSATSAGSRDGTIVQWDAATGKALRRVILDHGPFKVGTFSADRTLLATAGNEDKAASATVNADTNRTVRLWDVATGKEIHKITDTASTIGGIAFSPDGKRLASMSQKHLVHLWDVKTGKLIRKLDGNEPICQFQGALVFSPNSRTLASGGNDGKIRLWDADTGKKLREIQIPGADQLNRFRFPKYVSHLAFSPDGLLLASTGLDQDIYIWEVASGKAIRQFIEPGRRVQGLAFTSDSKELVFNDKDGILGQWNVASGAQSKRFVEAIRPCFGADGKTLLATRNSSIVLWDLGAAKDKTPLREQPTNAASLSLSPDGRTLATHGDKIRLWDVATSKLLHAFGGPKDWELAFSPDGKILAAAGFHNELSLWNTITGKEIRRVPISAPTLYLTFRPDGKLLVGTSGLRLIDPVDGKQSQLSANKTIVRAIAFSADGKQMLTSTLNAFEVCDADSGRVIRQSARAEIFNATPTFSADGKWFALAGTRRRDPNLDTLEQCVQVYRTANGKLNFKAGRGAGGFRKAVFSPDSRTLATSDDDGRVHLWEQYSGQERHILDVRGTGVYSLAFGRDGRTLIVGGLDGAAIVWDIGSPMPRDLKPADFDDLWADLAKDAAKAFLSIRTLAAAPRQTVPFFSKKLQAEKPIPAEQLLPLIAALGSPTLKERQRAESALLSLGDLAESALRKATLQALPLEHVRRIDDVLSKLPTQPLTPDELRNLRAVEALEIIGTEDAQQILTVLAKGAPDARLTQEAHATLKRLAK